MNKKLACVIVNYNDYETTSGLVNSIKDYSRINYIIVVDNKSPDNSLERLKTLETDRIIVISSGKNGGYGYGNNCGIKYAIDVLDCDYCIVANPDVIFSEDILYPMISFLDNNSNYGVVAPYQKGTTKQAWKKTGVFKDQLFYNILLNKLFNPRYYPDAYYKQSYCDVYAVKGCFLMFRSDAIKSIDYYDEDFFLFEEEKVIAYKLEQHNLKSAVLTNIEYIHNHSVSIKKTFKKLGQSKKLVLKSNELYLRKYMNVNNFQMFFIKIYHALCVLESIIYEFIISIKGK